MSKPSRRPNRDAIKQQRKDRKKAQNALRKRQKSQGLVTPNKASMPNRKCEYETVEQEEAARVDAATEQLKIFRSQLPTLLRRLAKIFLIRGIQRKSSTN